MITKDENDVLPTPKRTLTTASHPIIGGIHSSSPHRDALFDDVIAVMCASFLPSIKLFHRGGLSSEVWLFGGSLPN